MLSRYELLRTMELYMLLCLYIGCRWRRWRHFNYFIYVYRWQGHTVGIHGFAKRQFISGGVILANLSGSFDRRPFLYTLEPSKLADSLV